MLITLWSVLSRSPIHFYFILYNLYCIILTFMTFHNLKKISLTSFFAFFVNNCSIIIELLYIYWHFHKLNLGCRIHSLSPCPVQWSSKSCSFILNPNLLMRIMGLMKYLIRFLKPIGYLIIFQNLIILICHDFSRSFDKSEGFEIWC